jgi:hypothetical protein
MLTPRLSALEEVGFVNCPPKLANCASIVSWEAPASFKALSIPTEEK